MNIQLIPPALQGTRFDYALLGNPDLAAEAQDTARRIRDRLQTSYLDTGNDLNVMKEKLGYGRFGPWLEAEFSMSVRSAEECMSAARLATKYAVTAYLPPTTWVALSSRSADPGIIEGVLDDVKAGKPPPSPTKVKEMLAKARTAKKKSEAAQKTPEQIKKEQAAQKRADLRHQKKWDDIKTREAENKAHEIATAEKAAKLLVTGLGAAGTIKLFTIMSRVSFDQVGRLFGDRSVLGDYRFLPESEIEAKFGRGGGSRDG
jgi:hypothetical protein